MANWKTHLNYNYTPYHAYAYGLLYQHGFDQNHGAMNVRGDPAGPTPAYLAAGAVKAEEEESPPHSPEEHAGNGQYHYPSSEFEFLEDTTAERLIFNEQRQASVDERPQGIRQAGSDTASDSETYISPGSWSSASSREGSQPQADYIAWAKTDQDEMSSRSPDTNSCSSPIEEPRSYMVLGNEPNHNDDGGTAVSHMEANARKMPITNTPKAKARATFSESQMNILSERFSMQRYLSPSEMRGLAEVTKLTYKQVKTWFQNRRMKLRREQKSTGTVWGPERYAASTDCHGGAPLNRSSHGPPAAPHNYYRGEARPQLKEHYTQHVMEAALKNPASQNLAFYLATVAPNSRSAGYPSWPSIRGMPQTTGAWSVPPGVGHYDCNPSAFSVAGGPPAEMARQGGKNESNPADSRRPPSTALVNVGQ